MRRLTLAFLALCAAAGPAMAQDRSPAARRSLVDLAYTLGQAHGLALVCDGETQTWRARMTRLRELEAAEEAFDRQLVNGFNAGFVDAQGRFPACSRAARAESAAVASRGRSLSRVIASAR
ncbi:MAG TPA: TIGR02301 family protein [Caulobacteraceae bacterium]|jgi:uncharacterized protein (TIGR02301 family)